MTDDDRVESESTTPARAGSCVTIAVAAVAAFVISLIVADALGLVAVPAISDLLDRLEKVVSILVGLLGVAGLVVMKRTSQVDLRAVRVGATTGLIALLVCLPLFPSPHDGAAPATMPNPSSRPSPIGDDPRTPSVRGRTAASPATGGTSGITRTGAAVGPGRTRGTGGVGGGDFRGSGVAAGSATEPSGGDRVSTPGHDRPGPVPSRTSPSSPAPSSGRTESTPSLVIRQSEPPMTVSVTAEDLAEAEAGDFRIAPGSITPIAPSSLSTDCDPRNYQPAAVPLDAATRPVTICARTRAGLEVVLRLAPHLATDDETDRLLTVSPRLPDDPVPPAT